MHKVQCDGCKNEVRVALFFYDKYIIIHEDSDLKGKKHYEAFCRGSAICPICGCSIEKIFVKTILGKDIVDLAVGE